MVSAPPHSAPSAPAVSFMSACPTPLPKSPLPYRGVSEAVSFMSECSRPRLTLLALFFRSRIYFSFGRAAPQRWLERPQVMGAALRWRKVLLAAAGSQGQSQKPRSSQIPQSQLQSSLSCRPLYIVSRTLSFAPKTNRQAET